MRQIQSSFWLTKQQTALNLSKNQTNTSLKENVKKLLVFMIGETIHMYQFF